MSIIEVTKLQAALYPYQVEDVQWLQERPRCILGSDMGIGKTLEALALTQKLSLDSTLVICPKSLVSEWEMQIERWLGKERLDNFVVLNYEKLRKPLLCNKLNEYKWDLIVFDECHKLKNIKAKQTKGAFNICRNGSRVILMSGTPMLAGPQDLFSLLKIVDPQTFTSYWTFVNYFCQVVQLPKYPFPRIIVGSKNSEQLSVILSDIMLRRKKEEVLDLPKKTYRTIPVTLEAEQRKKYKQMEDELFVLLDSGEKITAPAVLAQMTRLRQICLDPNLLSQERKSTPSTKTLLLLDLLEGTNEPIVIFTAFEQYARILDSELTKHKISHVLYTGSVKTESRRRAVNEFQEGKHKALIGTITTMGLGITLTRASTVIFTDSFWTPAINEQCIDRLHRISQTKPVLAIELFTEQTIEAHVHRVIQRKNRAISSVLLQTEAIKSLTTERQRVQGGAPS